MNRLAPELRAHVVHALCEGNSIRATERLFGVHRDTICRLLVQTGERCSVVMSDAFSSFESDHLQFDEVWTFCGMKRLTLKRRGIPEKATDWGDWYIFSCLDTKSRCVPVYVLGRRNKTTTSTFLDRVRSSLSMEASGPPNVEISTDAFDPYESEIIRAFGLDVDYGQIHKEHRHEISGRGRYAPPRFGRVRKEAICGNPRRMTTSYVERHNWTLRGINRRMTRLSNGFSQKLDNLKAQVALGYYFYNMVKSHRSLGGATPAMALGSTDRAWTLAEVA